MSFRKENKFRLSHSDMAQLQDQLITLGMEELYPCRVVNSCYFDNESLSLFQESEEGVLPRKKIRIRWYDNRQDFTKETKISSIEGRFKSVQKKPKLQHLDAVLKTRYFDSSYGILKPSLIVSYERHYFSFKSLRITFDRNISYKSLKYKTNIVARDNEDVMEVKSPINYGDDYIKSIISQPTSRFSKYSRGLLCFDRN
ncbi:VTC domain-containing protein [Candidatus Pseudothioglobus sp. Uisw_041]|jgi:hypothetical protein|uniref:VTC domain-containing protein n=1 Tax=Candidatus Pseudothioglobus sp. Uisw_041 TaxID=3230996 RepID=UPI003A892E67